MQIVGCEFDFRGADVFFQAFQFCSAWNWNDPWLLCEQPGERDLGRRRLFPFRDFAKQIDQPLILPEGLRREAWQRATEVGAVELRVFVELARQEAPAQR